MTERKTVLVVLVGSTLLTMLGMAGIFIGGSQLSKRPDPIQATAGDPGSEARAAFDEVLQDTMSSHPYRRPLAAANIFVSGLVLIGSFMLSWRRKNALWMIKQSVLAKLIWIAVNGYLVAAHIRASSTTLLPALRAYEQHVDVVKEVSGELSVDVVAGLPIMLAFLSASVHAAVCWRVTRPDVAEFVAESAAA